MLPKPLDSIANRYVRTIYLETGASLFAESDRTRGMFFVESGLMELRRHTAAGDKIVVHRAGFGETFAEASLFSSRYHCDAVAQSDSNLIQLSKAGVLDLFSKDVSFATALAARFASQVQSYRRRLELAAIKSAEERTYAAVADGMLKDNVISLASEIGLTHEATYRALSRLARDGRIARVGRGRYELALDAD